MTFTGIILLAGFLIFAALMVLRLLPTLLALPLLAAWIAFVAGMPFVAWLNDVLLGGALRLASPIALVIFGAMFARVIQKTGISDAIIKKANKLYKLVYKKNVSGNLKRRCLDYKKLEEALSKFKI